MEKEIIHKSIKKCSDIYDHPAYYLFSGNGFRSMKKTTKQIVRYPEIRHYALKLAFLPGNRLLVEDSKRVYHIVDLDAGMVLRSVPTPRKGRLLCGVRRFGLSADNQFAFDTWFIKNRCYLVRIDLSDLSCTPMLYKPYLNLIKDMQCMDTNRLKLLETKVEEINGEGRIVNQITLISIDGSSITSSCEKNWISPRSGGAFCLLGTDVMECDLYRTSWQTGERVNLLEHSDFQWPENFHPLERIYDAKHDIIQLVDSNQNIFIDCAQKKVIARYFTPDPGFIGARIGDRFWIGTEHGISSVAFPYIENAES